MSLVERTQNDLSSLVNKLCPVLQEPLHRACVRTLVDVFIVLFCCFLAVVIAQQMSGAAMYELVRHV